MHCSRPGHMNNHLTKDTLKSTAAAATLVSLATKNGAGKGVSLEDSSAGAELYILTLAVKLRNLCTRSTSHWAVCLDAPHPQKVRYGLSSKRYASTESVLFLCSLTPWILLKSGTNVGFAWTETLKYFFPLVESSYLSSLY